MDNKGYDNSYRRILISDNERGSHTMPLSLEIHHALIGASRIEPTPLENSKTYDTLKVVKLKLPSSPRILPATGVGSSSKAQESAQTYKPPLKISDNDILSSSGFLEGVPSSNILPRDLSSYVDHYWKLPHLKKEEDFKRDLENALEITNNIGEVAPFGGENKSISSRLISLCESNEDMRVSKSKFDWKNQEIEHLKLGPITRTLMKKLKASNGNEDNVMVAYMEEALKNKFEELKAKERHLSCSQFAQLVRIIQGNDLMVKMAKYRRKGSLPPMVALSLPSLVGFCRVLFGRFHTYCRRSSNCVMMVLRPLFPQEVLQEKEVILGKVWNQIYNQLKIHIKVVPEQPSNEGFKTFNSNMEEDSHYVQQALEGIEHKLLCLAKGCEGLKKRRGIHLGSKYPRNYVRNGGNYVNMDERFHKRKGDMRDTMIVIIIEDIIVEEVLRL
ncbi:hypothetical protein M9H77_22685 [Catharanthus roseus]|uniref:Uncharacterized protein n=1 Tax=Catharanthus roseus TaxID=4058 RepID=A0ACC0ATP2_CATRO|nr:hypothetical protein M9H77_22685 [Catharanthus roseus]